MDNGLPSKLDGRVETVNVDGDEDWHHTPPSPYAVGWISHDRSSSHVLGLTDLSPASWPIAYHVLRVSRVASSCDFKNDVI